MVQLENSAKRFNEHTEGSSELVAKDVTNKRLIKKKRYSIFLNIWRKLLAFPLISMAATPQVRDLNTAIKKHSVAAQYSSNKK